MYVFGVFYEIEHLVSISKSLWHPFDELRHLPDYLTRASFNVLNNWQLNCWDGRTSFVQRFMQRVQAGRRGTSHWSLQDTAQSRQHQRNRTYDAEQMFETGYHWQDQLTCKD